MKKMVPWIAVPSYWTFPTTERGREISIFDHPTPLDQEGDLARMLTSFRVLKGEFNVLIVAAGTNPVLGRRIHEKVSSVVRPFCREFPIFLVSDHNLGALNRLLPEPILSLVGYGNIRNVQLALPYLAGADLVVGIDDDEIIEDADYLNKVRAAVGSTVNGEVVAGIAGPYFDRAGEYRIRGAESLASCENMFIKKNYFMNEALKKVMANDSLKRSNVAFGGNMAMSRETIARVCHDAYIPRGEDYDYVINAAMSGRFYYFLPTAGIVHLPPDSTGSQAADTASKLLADIRRFIYMREKSRLHAEMFPAEQFDPGYLLPYPGCYLNKHHDLRVHGIDAIRQKISGSVSSPEDFVDEAIAMATVKAREFFAYRETWRRVLAEVKGGGDTMKALEIFQV